jgi:hypothetical protein
MDSNIWYGDFNSKGDIFRILFKDEGIDNSSLFDENLYILKRDNRITYKEY